MKLFKILALIAVLALFGCGGSGTTPEGEEAAAEGDSYSAPAVTYTDVVVPADTVLAVQFLDTISSDVNATGDSFSVSVVEPIVVNGVTAIDQGSVVFGNILEVVPSKKIGAGAQMNMEFTRVMLPSGEEYPLSAVFTDTAAGAKKKDVATIGGSAAGGALLGRIVGHKKGDEAGGTAIGAVVGAAVGTAIAANNENDPVVIEQGTVVELLLDAPVAISIPN
ncbi:MAG: hypothetical protein IFK94_14475 [Acidobacteria bacterium]|uniref:Glycine zipper domain-containing protein n=1 Tax=Candidatus Polarisedimenticola svalbardensis TaxID=2886004 RepID=A0A8J6Y2M0_9BACT|nr:hypothetical protein [Candidatus Polarisedimenticola svalbardensis]